MTGKIIDARLPEKGRIWKDDKEIAEKHVDLTDSIDMDDFGSQGIEVEGVSENDDLAQDE